MKRLAKRCLGAMVGLGFLSLAGCGVVYHSPTVNTVSPGSEKVRVIDITAESLLAANQSPYQPKTLPAIFYATAGASTTTRGAGALPEPIFDGVSRPRALETRIPPARTPAPYRIGVGDVLLLATPRGGSTVEELSGILAATNSRQGYTVQDDGAVAIPQVGRVSVAGLTLDEAESNLFQRLVENQIDPTFSLEIAEFNSKKVAIGGAVSNPGVVPVTLTPLYLDEALSSAGGISAADPDVTAVRIYRDGTLYQVPMNQLYARNGLQRILLQDGDSIFVDTSFELDNAKTYFEQQITIVQARQAARNAALAELNAEFSIRRNALNEARSNFNRRLELGAEDRDYVYLTGQVAKQSRFALPFGNRAVLADAIYDTGEGFNVTVADVRQIYVLRGSEDPREFGAITAWRLNAANAANLTMATKFELRPDDVIFIAEQPVTRWNRTIQQLLPSLTVVSRTSALAN